MLKFQKLGLSLVLMAAMVTGCQCGVSTYQGPRDAAGKPQTPPVDRPFPLGQVTDAHTDTQETNAEAFKFIMYDMEFRESVGKGGVMTTTLTPDGKKHLMQIALRLPQVPFPVVIEEGENRKVNELRRTSVIGWICAFHQIEPGDPRQDMVAGRVVIAPAIEDGFRADELVGAASSSRLGGGHSGGRGGY